MHEELREHAIEALRIRCNAIRAHGRPFPQAGDVLFVRSNGKASKLNIGYQKARRPDYPKSMNRFSHVGLVVDHGIVMHSLANKGKLIRQLEQDLGFELSLKHGVTLDSLNTSGFLSDDAKDFAAFRHPALANAIERQYDVSEKAMDFFGMSYNFSIDHKQKVYAAEGEELRLHCSDLVERVLVDTGLKSAQKHASETLPIDVYHDLSSDPDWQDVTEDYRKLDRDHDGGLIAGIALTHQLVFLRIRIEQFLAARAIAEGLKGLQELVAAVAHDPTLYAEAIAELVEREDFDGDVLTRCYRGLTIADPTYSDHHVLGELTRQELNAAYQITRAASEDTFETLLLLCFRWSASALSWLSLQLPSDDPVVNASSDELVAEMTRLANGIYLSFDQALHAARVFSRLVRLKAVNDGRNLELAAAFHELAVIVALIRRCAELRVDNTDEYSSKLREILEVMDFRELVVELLSHSYVNHERLKDEYKITVDFARMVER
ncbi:MAG: hypothetical protein AAFY56_17880 [Pseudomonadota bacterium]